MPRSANFFVPLRVEGWGGRPPLDLDGWDHVAEFSLTVPSGKLALASGGGDEVTVGIAPGAYRARWSGRNLGAAARWERLDENAPDTYRLQIWPGPAAAPRAEIKRWSGSLRGELGDLPALLDDEDAAGDRRGLGHGAHRRRAADRGPARRDRQPQLGADDPRRRRRALGREQQPLRPRRRCTPSTPGLLPFADDRGALSFRGRPDDPERLAHALRAAHAELAGRYIAFEDVVNALVGLEALLTLGYGQLANGPATLLRRYEEVADAHGVATQPGHHRPRSGGSVLLELGECSWSPSASACDLGLAPAAAVRVVVALLAAAGIDGVDDQALDQDREEHDPDRQGDERDLQGGIGENRPSSGQSSSSGRGPGAPPGPRARSQNSR